MGNEVIMDTILTEKFNPNQNSGLHECYKKISHKFAITLNAKINICKIKLMHINYICQGTP